MRYHIDETYIGGFHLSCEIQITDTDMDFYQDPDDGRLHEYYTITDFDVVSDITVGTDSGAVAITKTDDNWKATLKKFLDWENIAEEYRVWAS